LATAAQYGYSEARLALTEQSAVKQSAQNMSKIAGEAYAADMQAYGTILNAPIPEMAQTTYQGTGYNAGLNTALSIGGGVVSGAQFGASLDYNLP